MHACMRAYMRFAHGFWFRPHQSQGQGEGGEQREEEREIFFSYSVSAPEEQPKTLLFIPAPGRGDYPDAQTGSQR